MPYYQPRKLAKAAAAGHDKLKTHRQARQKLLAEYVGRLYLRQSDSVKATPINLIFQAVTTLVPNLAYNDPRVRASSRILAYKPYAEVLELATNHLVKEIGLRDTLRRVITDALFPGGGWIKIGLGVTGQTLDVDGILRDIGQPYADRVDPGDIVIDPAARHLDEAYFHGNRYRVDKEWLLESGLIEPDLVRKLPSFFASDDFRTSAEMLGHSEESASGLQSHGWTEYADLLDLYIPSENRIVTFPWTPDGSSNEFLREVDHEGPENGLYRMLGFAFAPDNPIPVAPAGMWLDLHTMANSVARKIHRQAERNKKILAYEGTAWEDAQRVVDSEDGESVKVEDINKLKEFETGGVTEDAYRFEEWAKGLFSEMAMNIDLLSGTGTNEPTATQAEMLHMNSSIRLADMQNLVYQFTAGVCRDLVFFLHTDPLIELPLVKRTQGVDQQVYYTPEMREGDWLDYSIDVVPYSMARQDPNLRVRRIMEFIGNAIPAMANAAQLLGPTFKLEQTLRMVGREMGIDDLEEIIDSQYLAMVNQRTRQMLEAGVPIDAKVLRTLMNPMAGSQVMTPSGMSQPPVPTRQPNQPNPSAGFQQGITPGTETNQLRQGIAAELQSEYTRSPGTSAAGMLA